MIAFGKLYIVSTPIGDRGDITLRAIEILKSSDLIVGEEAKPARALLAKHSIEKPLVLLNEHSNNSMVEEIIEEIESGKTVSLISDCGTPLIADPGNTLVAKCIDRGIDVHPIPGASSILAALVVCGFSLERFSFVGFLPRNKPDRISAAKTLRAKEETLVLLEAPYRLLQLLEDLELGIGSSREAVVACDLTLPTERIARGTLGELHEQFEANKFKGEFVIVIEGSNLAKRDTKMPRFGKKKSK